MLKKLVLLTIVALSVISLPARAALWNNDEITMLVMPREVLPLQIAQDISRRYPVLIVSYHLSLGELKIYAWNGESWVRVSTEDYVNGTFFANRPKSAIVVENERFHAPAEMIPNSTWCESASRVSSTDPRVLLHLLGLQFDFPYRHWDQLAKRYGYELEEINPTLQNVHWWNLRADALLEKRAKRNFTVDLDKWYDVATLPPPAIEPIMKPALAPIVNPTVPEKTGATAVDITAKAPESKKAEKAPAVKPAPAKAKPAPAAAKVKPAPVAKPAPVVEPTPAPLAEKPAPAIEPVQAAPEPVATETAAPAVKEAEPTAVAADPFSSDEIPAAEIVVPQTPKKPWWKF